MWTGVMMRPLPRKKKKTTVRTRHLMIWQPKRRARQVMMECIGCLQTLSDCCCLLLMLCMKSNSTLLVNLQSDSSQWQSMFPFLLFNNQIVLLLLQVQANICCNFLIWNMDLIGVTTDWVVVGQHVPHHDDDHTIFARSHSVGSEMIQGITAFHEVA